MHGGSIGRLEEIEGEKRGKAAKDRDSWVKIQRETGTQSGLWKDFDDEDDLYIFIHISLFNLH